MNASFSLRKVSILSSLLIILMANSAPSANATTIEPRNRIAVMPFFESADGKASGQWVAKVVGKRLAQYHRTTKLIDAASVDIKMCCSGWQKICTAHWKRPLKSRFD